jgi:hypothetical protein
MSIVQVLNTSKEKRMSPKMNVNGKTTYAVA